jgi:oxygen-dependent protoporphyrinogen oxidase
MVLKQGAKVAVIGTGVSGLSYGHFLKQLRPDVQLTLYDSASTIGGYIQSHKTDVNGEEVILEKGPRTLRGASDGTVIIIDTLLKLGSKDQINVIPGDSESNKKYLLSPGDKLVQVPNSWKSFKNFISSPLGSGLVGGFIKEPFKKSTKIHDESVDSFITRRFGPQLAQNVISAIYHGIYAGDIRKLSAKTVMKAMFEGEQQYGSVIKSLFKREKINGLSPLLTSYESKFQSEYPLENLSKALKKFPMITFTDGLGVFPKMLHESLKTRSTVKLNTPVRSIKQRENMLLIQDEQYDHVHSTINPKLFSKLIPETATSSVASKLSSISILLTNVYLPTDVLPYHGFGYLIPSSNKNPHGILGVIFDSDIEKGRVSLFPTLDCLNTGEVELKPVFKEKGYTKLTIMTGGHFLIHPPSDIDKMTQESIRAVESHLGVSLQDAHVESEYIQDCLPQFHVGYDDLKQSFHHSLEKEFSGLLSYGGMAFSNGCGVPDCVSHSYKSVLELIE